MKFFLSTICIAFTLFINIGASAQSNLNGYKYVYVHTIQYQNGGVDIWSISSKLRNYFSEKGFIVVRDNNIPEEVKKNRCLLVRCEIDHTGVEVGTNQVTLRLINCKEEVVYQSTGKAMGLTIQDDYNKATKRAFEGIQKIPYSFDSQLTPSLAVGTAEVTNENESSLKNYFSTASISALEGIYKSYQSNGNNYYKIGIIKKQDRYLAIILESESSIWKTGEVKGYLEPSSVKGVFSTTWLLANKSKSETFATLENDAILSVEIRGQDGQTSITKFIKIYPAKTEGSVSNIEGTKSSGSGFFVSTNGLIATNAHVVENAKKIKVRISNEMGVKVYDAKLELKDTKNDVAVIRIEDNTFKELMSLPYTFVDKAEIGEKTFTIGYPLNDVMGTNYKVTDGLISSNSGIDDDIRYYQISVPIQPGNSGGPLFNRDGNIIGLTTAKLNPKAVGTYVENVNYAIKVQYLNNILNMLPYYNASKSQTTLKGKELQEQVKALRYYVCLIEIEN